VAPLKTFSSDKPTETAGDGWTASSLQHADPSTASAPQPITAEKPVEPSPTVAPPGPVVEPAPPAHDLRDVPAAKTSGTGLLKPITSDHTT